MSAASLIEMLSILAALAGTISLVIWPLFPSRRTMLLVQAVIAVGFGLHYGLEGLATAALLNGLGGSHVLISLIWGTNPRLRWVGYAMIPLTAVAAILTWSGLPSILAGVGMVLIALGRVQTNERRLRLLILAGTPFWLLHDILGGSSLVIADALSIGMGLLMLHKDARSRSKVAALPDMQPLSDHLVPNA